MTMVAALCALLAAAVAGGYLAARHFLRRRLPAWGALLHGVGGATGFALVLLTVAAEPGFQPARGVLVLLIATIGLGCVNLLFHVRRVRHRTSLILMHGLCAVSAAGWLVYAIGAHHTAPSAAPAPPPPAREVAPAPPAPPIAMAPPPAPAEPHRPVTLDPDAAAALAKAIAFDTSSAELGRDAQATVAHVAEALKAHPEITLVQVQGHTDERGDETVNANLARARAAVVMGSLVAGGVARERLQLAGYGARCPADPACQPGVRASRCHGTAQWDRDRRVAFRVLELGGLPFAGAPACEVTADNGSGEDGRFFAR